MTSRFLMCPPTYYKIEYDINPWMSRNLGVPTENAGRQWDRLVEVLQTAGDVELSYLEPQSGIPDMVFTGSSAFIIGQLAIISSFRYEERRREQALSRAWLAAGGFATTYLTSTFFEGAGDALFDRRRPLLYVGYGWRSERQAALQLSEHVNVRVLPLQLIDPRFYYLYTALCPLASGHVMVYMDAFSEHSQRLLRRTIEPEYLIEVSTHDAVDFACNAIEVGDAVVMHTATRILQQRLHAAGYSTFQTDLSEFIRSGGSARSLVLRLDDGPAVAIAAA